MAKKKKAVSAVQEFMDKGITPDCPKELNPTAIQKVETELTHEKPPETRPLDEALSDIVAKQTDELKNEPVSVTEIKPLSEKVLASLYEKHNVPRDFNASHPRWSVPSVKNRYALLLADISIHEKL